MRLTPVGLYGRSHVKQPLALASGELWLRWVGWVTVHSAPFVLINLRSVVRQSIGRGLGRRDRW